MNRPLFPPVAASDTAARFDLMQAALDMVSQGFTIIDADLRLVAWNRGFIEMLDFPPEFGRFGTPFETFMRYNAERGEYGPGPVEELVAQRVAAARAFAPHYFERERPNGRIIAVRGEPVPGRGFVTLYTDITEQRHSERLIREQNNELERRVAERTEALSRSEERLRLITDAIPALIAYFDREQVYRFANRGYAEWFGRGKEDVPGRRIAEVMGAPLHAELLPQIEAVLAGRSVSYEYSLRHADGTLRHASSTLVPEFGPGGEVRGGYVLSADVTEQKATQAALLQARKMEAVGQLAGGLAHDFNNMLTVVIGNLAALKERHPDDIALADCLDPALTAARRGVDLIRRLLSFARQQSLEPRPVDVARLVDELLPLLRRSLPESIAVDFPAPAPGLFAMTDPHQLENALLNLAFNARDAMAGGGRLAIRLASRTLAGAAAADLDLAPGDYVEIVITDSGQGMSAAVLARALEPFFTTKGYAAGSGLGLSMVYGFAKQSGGGLRLASAPGAGTEAWLHLPRCAPAAQAEAEGIGALPATPGHGLVLLVEDDAEVRRVVRMQLTGLGYPVIEAANGAEGLALLEQIEAIALVLSDVVMPGGIDGPRLAREVRARRPEVGVLLMSGYAGGPDVIAGEVPLLAKPFASHQLAAALEACRP
ncbi:MAG: PAS-domain containing protein [Rhodocyclales bacterium]|nr:PAS-domain containing protein [Rhodocyclales bacterium]